MIKDAAKAESDACVVIWTRIAAFLDLKAVNTQRTYISVLREWCHFLGAELGTPTGAKLIIHATDLHAAAYRHWLLGKAGQAPRLQMRSAASRSLQTQSAHASKRDGLQNTLADATLAKKFAALRRIYRMLIAADLGVKINPFDPDRLPAPSAKSGQKRPTEMIDFSLVKSILELPDRSDPKGLRDLALLCVLFGGGLRRSEAVALRVGDVKLSSNGTCFLRLRSTKSKRDADQALPDWAAAWVLALVKARKQEGAYSGDYLFVSYRGPAGRIPTQAPLSPSGLYRLFKSYCLKAGASQFVTPHSARATAITKLLEEGFNHREVREFSRHASVQMVELYDKRRMNVDQSPAKALEY